MKHQGVWVMRIVTLFLCVFMVLYIGYHIFIAFYDPLRTVTCVLLATEEAVTVKGFFVHNEALLSMPEGTLRFSVADGQRVSPGQVVAGAFENSESLSDGQELRLLENYLAQLQYIAGRTVTVSDTEDTKALLRSELISLKDNWDAGRFGALDENSMTLRAALFREEYTLRRRDDLDDMIAETEAKISALQVRIEHSTVSVPAPYTGLFCSAPDGYEGLLTPASIQGMTTKEFNRLYKLRPESQARTAKMVTDDLYYYVCLLPESSAALLGGAAQMRFVDELSVFLQEMRVEKISLPEDGYCVVTLSSRRYQARFFSDRLMNADIVFSEHRGLRVPRDAVRVDEVTGQPYVFCDVVGQITRKNISIISDVSRENYYLCEFLPESQRNLLPGDEIVTIGKDLYDGKVVVR